MKKLRKLDHKFKSPTSHMFNIPKTVVLLSGVLVFIHFFRNVVLSPEANLTSLLLFAFIPGRYTLEGANFPGGIEADLWTFITYAFLHGSLTHLGFNILWMLVFGSIVARRFGTYRFLLLSAFCALAGSVIHLATHMDEIIPMIGASAGISGQMGAATRFAFSKMGPLDRAGVFHINAYRQPADGLKETFTNPRVFWFLTIWFGLNFLFSIWSPVSIGEGSTIAWQAHMGGFLLGLLAFHYFDPIKKEKSSLENSNYG